MAPKRKKMAMAAEEKMQKNQQEHGGHGMFEGMCFFLVHSGVQPRRLQIWKQKILQMGGTINANLSDRVTHVLAIDSRHLQDIDPELLKSFQGSILRFDWLESSLKSGEKLPEECFILILEPGRNNEPGILLTTIDPKPSEEPPDDTSETPERDVISYNASKDEESQPNTTSSLYHPPDLNRSITEIFGKLINIYRALGDDRRSFSYYKAIPVIEKLPFKIENADQIKDLPTIGKSLKDHIQEILSTGKLSKLEHFETDEKARVVSLFGEVWGVGPATALKLYEKGHRTLKDLEKESLTNSQRLGLKYFEDIKKKIPRSEVKEMEYLLQKASDFVKPGMEVVCGGSYRRGKAYCGDLDIIITHSDGHSHKGFLPKYVNYLREIKFVREDLVFSVHSIEDTDSGIDTYFGLCTYPGREQRHRIDFKVYPRDKYAFGLIAWTGNDVLNRRLRLLAESKGYRLDDTGLYFATQTSGGKRSTKSLSFSCMTEREVFDVLGFPWLEPHERNL